MIVTNILEKHHYKVLISFFAVIFSLGYILISYDANKKIEQHLVDTMENRFIQYRLIYNTYKKNSQIIHLNIENNKEIIKIYKNLNENNKDESREKLFKIISPLYTNAKKYGVKQLHFHLKNSESFLRMHKPKKFGDYLSDVRYSVDYVNKKHRSISGFEQGRIVHGFRYVYPITDQEGKHLGSVELSIGTLSFEEMFENTLFVNANLIIDKKISQEKVFEDELTKHYNTSLLSPLYLQAKGQATINKKLRSYIEKNLTRYQKRIQEKLESKKAFAIETEIKDSFYIQSFTPIKNIKEKKVIAYFITSSESSYLKDIHQETLVFKIALLLFTLMIVYVIHRNLNYSNELRKEIKRKTLELQESQKRVVQAEKMASLGLLITGVAHEVNTPVGLSITAITSLIDETKTLKLDYENQTMDETEFSDYLEKSHKTAQIIFLNLVRTAELVKNFKQLSTNQNLTDIVEIDIKLLTESLLISVDSKLKEKNITTKLSIEENLKIRTYADVLPQILNNFIANSLTHAFLNIKNPQIDIEIKKEKDKIVINYSDNGIGMEENSLKKVFDPFYTTNRGAGNSGLGMHIIYNLISDKLDGTIDITSQIDKGVEIRVTLPIVGK